MAQQKVYCSTKGCKNKVLIIGYSSKDLANKVAAIAHRVTCDDCKMDEREQENLKQSKYNADLGLEPLKGSVKQVLWAESLRYGFIQDMDDRIKKGFFMVKNTMRESLVTAMISEVMKNGVSKEALKAEFFAHGGLIKAVLHLLDHQLSASWWIDNKESAKLGQELGRIAFLLIKTNEIVPEESEVEKQLRVEIEAEALIYPDHPVTAHPVLIEVSGTKVRVHIDTSIERQKDIMYHSPFARDYRMGKFGMQEIDYSKYVVDCVAEQLGDPIDRAAEIAKLMLDANMPVKMYSEDARQKLYDGTFEPYCKYWITSVTPADYVIINHHRDDKLYEKIRKIAGSKWEKATSRCIVPISAYEQIISFAQINGYRITADMMQRLDCARQAAEIALLNPKKRTAPSKKSDPKPPTAKRPTLKKDMAPTTVAADLVDTDD